jgi:hypothetical protein
VIELSAVVSAHNRWMPGQPAYMQKCRLSYKTVSKSRQYQIEAAEVLANIHSDETWPHLVALLDSPVLWVRHHAVKGLEDTVYAGERSGDLAFGERPLVHLGQPVKRNVHKRPPVPDNIRGLFKDPERNDATLVAFWRDYASKNQ